MRITDVCLDDLIYRTLLRVRSAVPGGFPQSALPPARGRGTMHGAAWSDEGSSGPAKLQTQGGADQLQSVTVAGFEKPDIVGGNITLQIGEEAQDAIAIGGPRREGIGVQQIVAPTQTETAALLFEEKGSRGQKQCCMIPVVSSTSGQEQDRK